MKTWLSSDGEIFYRKHLMPSSLLVHCELLTEYNASSQAARQDYKATLFENSTKAETALCWSPSNTAKYILSSPLQGLWFGVA